MTLNASTKSFKMPAYPVRIAPIFKSNDVIVMDARNKVRNATFKYKSIAKAIGDGVNKAENLVFNDGWASYDVLALTSKSTSWWQFGLLYTTGTYNLSYYSKVTFTNNADVEIAGNGNNGYYGVLKSLDDGMYYSSISKFVERKNVNATELATVVDLSGYANDSDKYYLGIEYSTARILLTFLSGK